MHLDHVGGDSSEREAGMNAPLDHFFTNIFDRGKRSSTGPGLDRESFLEIAAVDDDLGCVHREQDVARVLGVADGSGRNLGGIPDRVHEDNIIHIVLGNRVRSVRIINKIVGDDHNLVSVLGVRLGVAEGSADGLGVIGAGVTAGVAGRVTGRSAQEGYINVKITVGDGASTSSVAAEHNRFLHQAVGNLLGEFAAES